MPARLLEDDAHRVQARLAGRERHARLVPVFRRHTLELTRPHVRRIRHDDIVGGAPERAEVIGLLEQHTTPETVGADVGARHLERRLRDIDRLDAGVRQRPRAGDGDAARARAEIEHPSHASRVDPRREAPLDQLRDRRAGHEHPRVDPDLEAREPGDAGQVGGRDALLDAPPEELRRARLRAGVDASAQEGRAAAGVGGYWLAQQLGRAGPRRTGGTWLPQPKAVRDFALTDTTGSSFTRASLVGAPSLVFFGFTRCPDVCPATLLELAQVRKAAALPTLRVVFVSVDPQRDTPALLGTYVHAFDPAFLGLTGAARSIAPMAADFGVAVDRVELPGGDSTMDHSAVVFLLDARARVVAVFTPPFEASPLAADLRRAAPWP